MSKTLVEIKHAVFEYFADEAVLCPSTQSSLIKFDCADEALKVALISEALKDLEKYEITRHFVVNGVSSWIVTKPLSTFERSISFGYDTLTAVADALNKYAAIYESQKVITDATIVNETDIQRLAMIASGFLSQVNKSS